jgi:uncharacterized protein (TIGR02186 family)
MTAAARALALLLAGLGLLVATPLRAERLIVSVSNDRVTVTSNYEGEELVLFGAVERDGAPDERRYDMVVTVSGPTADFVTRRKERKLGIWVNADSRQFLDVPGYLSVSANRPLAQITTPDLRRSLQLGLDHVLLTQRVGPDYADVVASDPFRRAFIRRRAERGLYREDTGAITFLTPTLFRTSIPLAAEAPIGTYTVDIKLLADGALVGRTVAHFEVVKVGFEQFVASAARHQPLAYGLVTVAMALATGWLASVVFRRD